MLSQWHTARSPAWWRRAISGVDVETAGELTRGRTVADPERLRGFPPNAEVGVDIDRARFVDLLVEAIASYG